MRVYPLLAIIAVGLVAILIGILLNHYKPPNKNKMLSQTLINKFLSLEDKADKVKLSKTENAVKEIQFQKYSENVFQDAGTGIQEHKWKGVVTAMGKLYGIPREGVQMLEQANSMAETEKTVYNIDIGGTEPGRFGYMRIAIEKENGDLSYILAGTQIKFNLAPMPPDRNGKVETEAVLSKEMEQNLEEYFLNKALSSAKRRYGESKGIP